MQRRLLCWSFLRSLFDLDDDGLIIRWAQLTLMVMDPAAKKSSAIISTETGLAVEHLHFTIDRPTSPQDFYVVR